MNNMNLRLGIGCKLEDIKNNDFLSEESLKKQAAELQSTITKFHKPEMDQQFSNSKYQLTDDQLKLFTSYFDAPKDFLEYKRNLGREFKKKFKLASIMRTESKSVKVKYYSGDMDFRNKKRLHQLSGK